MLTRCPRCETTFRVTPEQLKARQGKVRCGECQEVFNALDALIEAPATVAMPVEDAAPGLPAPPADNAPAEEAASVLPAESLPVTDTTDTVAAPTSADEPAEQPEKPAEAPAEAVEAPSVAEPEQDQAWTPVPEPGEPAGRRVWPWVVGMLAAACVLALQAAMHFRTEIATLHPATRAGFAAACEIVGCKLLLPRKAELTSIETSDLHPDPDGKLELSAVLKNRAPFAQEFPHLEITLTDTADRALVRRVLAPAEYLPPAAAPAGFAAGGELPVRLAIEVADIAAVGYRLYLFYP